LTNIYGKGTTLPTIVSMQQRHKHACLKTSVLLSDAGRSLIDWSVNKRQCPHPGRIWPKERGNGEAQDRIAPQIALKADLSTAEWSLVIFVGLCTKVIYRPSMAVLCPLEDFAPRGLTVAQGFHEAFPVGLLPLGRPKS